MIMTANNNKVAIPSGNNFIQIRPMFSKKYLFEDTEEIFKLITIKINVNGLTNLLYQIFSNVKDINDELKNIIQLFEDYIYNKNNKKQITFSDVFDNLFYLDKIKNRYVS